MWSYNYTLDSNELYHWGIKGMKWGIRRYQNKDGTLTAVGKQRFAKNRIRTEENLVEKTIPKGTKMYRATPYEKDENPSKTKYVTYLDVDRNLYKEGSVINSYTNKARNDKSTFEHEYELKTDIRIPSLKTVREIEKKVVSDDKKRNEVAKAWVESIATIDGFSMQQVNILSKTADKFEKCKTVDDRKKLYKSLVDEYGSDVGPIIYDEGYNMHRGKEYVDTNDYLTIERSFGRAHNVKNGVIKELQKMGYNAMYDNAGIGVKSDGGYTKIQEGVEPLIIFDSSSTLRENSVRRVPVVEQLESNMQYNKWKRDRDKILKKFK